MTFMLLNKSIIYVIPNIDMLNGEFGDFISVIITKIILQGKLNFLLQ